MTILGWTSLVMAAISLFIIFSSVRSFNSSSGEAKYGGAYGAMFGFVLLFVSVALGIIWLALK